MGEGFAAISDDGAVFGLGATVIGYDARTGVPRWDLHLGQPQPGQPSSGQPARSAPGQLAQLPPGAQVVSARAWPGVDTVGVAAGAVGPAQPSAPAQAAAPAQASPAPQPSASPRPSEPAQPFRSARPAQLELVLDSSTGRLIGSYPSIPFGGTVAADTRHAVVVGPGAVTSYDNATGKAAWRRPTGAAPQSWQLDGDYLYVAVAAGGYLGAQPTTALRRIDLRSGAERIIRPGSAAFGGRLSAALDGVVLFSGRAGVTAYSGTTGSRLWRVAGAVLQAADLAQRRFYLTEAGAVVGVDPRGKVQARLPGSAGLYGERGGVGFGLDVGAGGQAWGVSMQSQKVVWTASPLPWPHVFVDLSGLGGSADPGSAAIILAACGLVDFSAAPPRCAKPELVVINR